MCLDHSAHGVVPDHEIFRAPLPVTIAWETATTPSHYKRFWLGRDLPDAIPTWRVDRVGYQDDASRSPGVVAAGWGFEDSPDCEVIANGINSKGPNAVALGRQGPFFHWGFAAPPSGMTESGRRAFVNAICYIHRFDGRAPLVRKVAPARDSVSDTLLRTQRLEQGYEDSVRATEEHNAARDVALAARGKRELSVREQMYVKSPAWELESYEQYRAAHFRRSFPKELVEKLGTEDPDRYVDYYHANREYLVQADRYQLQVDEDARALGLSNRDVAMLDRAIDLLESGEGAARGQRLLERYTGQAHDSPEAWRSWLDSVRDDLFFSDVGGYRFFVADTVGRARAEFRGRRDHEPDDANPVLVDLRVTPAAARPGATITIGVGLDMAQGWHSYAAVEPGSPYSATSVELQLPDGAVALGEWDLPSSEPSEEDSMTTVYTGRLVFVRRVRLSANATGDVEIGVRVALQACNASMCLPPDTIEAAAVVKIEPPAR